jgi:hypothetical protein
MNREETQTLIGAVAATIIVVTGVMLFATNRKEIGTWVYHNVLGGNDSMICRPDCGRTVR